MPSAFNVLACAIAALTLCLCVGLPLARALNPERQLALPIAPAFGWAVFSVTLLPVLSWSGLSTATVALLCASLALAGIVTLYWQSRRDPVATDYSLDIPGWIYGAAALVAVVPALAAWPKLGGGGLVLAESMFDHSKVAMIDDMIRFGVPPGNPFFGEVGAAPGLAYYYLWHLSAAVLAKLVGASGWEADIALTWFTAFASLTLMMGFAIHLSGRRTAALWVVLLSLGGSLRPILWVIAPNFFDRLLSQYQSPKGWLFQATWVPQHLASAGCGVLAVYIMSRLAAPCGWLIVPMLAVAVAAGFASSAWVGGVIFGASAIAIGFALLIGTRDPRSRVGILLRAFAAVLLLLAISLPILRDEYVATAARNLGAPIALKPFEVLGPVVPDAVRRLLDLPAYWVILLALEFPAIYWFGVASLFSVLGGRKENGERERLPLYFGLLAAVSFAVVWLFASTIANNDLGWRGVLPGVMVLTIFAGAGLARWMGTRRLIPTAAALGCLALALPDGAAILRENAAGTPTRSAAVLAETPELWAAVRRHTTPDERVGNNPLFLGDSVRWPVNVSWALFAHRRSCFASWNLARAYVPLPEVEIDRINTLFERVFAGRPEPHDVEDLARRYGCQVVVVTATDGAWIHDPFVDGSSYQLVEEKSDKWRIYRVDTQTISVVRTEGDSGTTPSSTVGISRAMPTLPAGGGHL